MNGEIVTGDGNHVLSDGGGIISIPSDAKQIKIGQDGSISTDQGAIGRLMVVEFENLQDMEPQGNGLYQTSQGTKPPTNSVVIQGSIENSNVQPVLEMTRMIDVSRAYERSQQLIQTEHERLRTMIQRLSRSS
jgi:flagellar basal-body rod protein FlgF